MDLSRSPVFQDGPEYSRLSEGSNRTHWYAEGHADPDQEREEREKEREREKSNKSHQLGLGAAADKDKRRRKNSDLRRSEEEERRKLRKEISEPSGEDGARNHPKDPKDLSPKVSNPKPGERTSPARQTDVPRETTVGNVNGESADDESTPPPGTPTRSSPKSLKGAHYIPVTSVPDPVEGLERRDIGSITSVLETDDLGCKLSTMRMVTQTSAFLFTWAIFIFSLFNYSTIQLWLEPHLHEIINERVELSPNLFYSMSPLEKANIKLEVFFYNVTHVTKNGGIPQIYVQDKGPYTYQVQSFKTDVKWNATNSTVTYRIKDTFRFLANDSVGDQNDVINTMDANLLTKLSKMSLANSTKDFYVNLTDGMMRPQRVGDILMGGGDKTGSAVGQKRQTHKSSHRTDSDKTMESISPVYNVHTGNVTIYRLNQMHTFNYTRADRMWRSYDDHYPQTGSADGDSFPPFVKKDQTLALFYSQTETNLLLQWKKTVQIQGLEAYRFVLLNETLEDQPRDAPTSTPRRDVNGGRVLASTDVEDDAIISLDEEVDGAQNREAFSLQYLRGDSPFLVSFQPRHYMVPNGSEYKTCRLHLDIHRISGITIRKRLCHQMSLPVSFPGTKGQGFVLPIMWMNWFYESVPDDLDQLMTSYDMLKVVEMAKWTFLGMMVFLSAVVIVQIITAILMHSFNPKSVLDIVY